MDFVKTKIKRSDVCVFVFVSVNYLLKIIFFLRHGSFVSGLILHISDRLSPACTRLQSVNHIILSKQSAVLPFSGMLKTESQGMIPWSPLKYKGTYTGVSVCVSALDVFFSEFPYEARMMALLLP
jgi:hypothetical protein